jgi:hypothetical protein
MQRFGRGHPTECLTLHPPAVEESSEESEASGEESSEESEASGEESSEESEAIGVASGGSSPLFNDSLQHLEQEDSPLNLGQEGAFHSPSMHR